MKAEPGTPRGNYCDALEHISIKGTLFIVPVLAAACALLLLRRRPLIAVLAVLVIILLTILNMGIVFSLEHTLPLD